MINFDTDGIYDLLPAWIKVRDQAGNGALRALIGVLAAQTELIEDNLDQLYDDQFIETCQPWVTPYIGDLIGFRPLRALGPDQGGATRAEVANTIGYRRRKGTLALIEQLGFDVTGWPTIAVEYFTRLSTTQYVRNHLRPGNSIVDVRSPQTAVDIDGAFDLAPRTADVRRIASGRGRYNIPNIGVFVWRLATYGGAMAQPQSANRVTRTRPLARVANQYHLDPFGDDVPLVNPPVPVAGFSLAGRRNTPFPLPRYPLYAELDAARTAIAAGSPPAWVYFRDPAVFTVFEADGTPIAPENLAVCDLTLWNPPTAPGIRASVDPVLGRLVFAAPAPAITDDIRVSCAYGFSGDYGGGSYARALDAGEPVTPDLVVVDFAAADLTPVENLTVEIADSGIFSGDIALAPDANRLVIRAADFARPVIDGDLTITAVPGGSVTLRGLGVTGGVTITGAGPFTLALEHCQVRGLIAWPIGGGGILRVDHSLTAALEVNDAVAVQIADSVIDADADTNTAISAGAGATCGALTLARCTVVGGILARETPLIENSIVTGIATVTRLQDGCVRYNYVAPGAQTPRRFACQPDSAIAAAISQAMAGGTVLSLAQRKAMADQIGLQVTPVFTSRARGAPGYMQLSDLTPPLIGEGAEDGDEMGVFFSLYTPRREANLQVRLSEYIRIGLECGTIHST